MLVPETKSPNSCSTELSSNTFASIKWETASFYTYEAEVDGKPVPTGEPLPEVRVSV